MSEPPAKAPGLRRVEPIVSEEKVLSVYPQLGLAPREEILEHLLQKGPAVSTLLELLAWETEPKLCALIARHLSAPIAWREEDNTKIWFAGKVISLTSEGILRTYDAEHPKLLGKRIPIDEATDLIAAVMLPALRNRTNKREEFTHFAVLFGAYLSL